MFQINVTSQYGVRIHAFASLPVALQFVEDSIAQLTNPRILITQPDVLQCPCEYDCIGLCSVCGQPVCADCSEDFGDKVLYCTRCNAPNAWEEAWDETYG